MPVTMATEATTSPALTPEESRRRERAFAEFRTTLLGWPLWHEANRQLRVDFAEGGGIEHRLVRGDGAFVHGTVVYADLEFAMLRLRASRGERVEGIVRDRWQLDLTSRQIADKRHISLSTVTSGIRDGTTRLAEYATRLPDCRERVYDWLDDQARKHRYA